ncbi:hypothetical protein G6L26_014990 [Agrobacterium radiobacter]|uniref:Uncharacterized protein n=1 Tax=Agrobacterium tumefaciens str. B6 TaxID=1183423 RepID=A0A822V5A9_AGRTU|nr:hypothetical protein [Agrobacterium tumefaciens]NTA06433.1 hypothetical protein [Agrobacterium tumefaciens]NTA92874.1 hypothetical protein [Agrobacterium tumefaciens]NTB14080.1 hypothetical protein [Agrobacterium tumefaciens]CVI20274.1 hypothetical protein AGR4A_Lc10031 [Agrobacterium tumefaciens str. B6]
MASAEAAEPDNLQTYVEKRLKGVRIGADWLDSLPLYVAIRLCEIVGASLLHGNLFRSSGFGEPTYTLLTDDWPRSNPKGYANWFASRQAEVFERRQRAVQRLRQALDRRHRQNRHGCRQ